MGLAVFHQDLDAVGDAAALVELGLPADASHLGLWEDTRIVLARVEQEGLGHALFAAVRAAGVAIAAIGAVRADALGPVILAEPGGGCGEIARIAGRGGVCRPAAQQMGAVVAAA